MATTSKAQTVLDRYNAGHRYFLNLDFQKGERFGGHLLAGSIFENCYFSADLSTTNLTDAKFVDCTLKYCDFSLSNLTNVVFENCWFQGNRFKDTKIEGASLNNCHCSGQVVILNEKTGQIEILIEPLVRELYDNVPEFSKIADHDNEQLVYTVFGELSLKLLNDIKSNENITEFTIKCFQFFNLLGDREDEDIDNLLVVGVYERLYANKKSNDIARSLLTRRNKDIYEYWMKNGDIRSDY